MKCIRFISLLTIACLLTVTMAYSQSEERATKEECILKCKEAAQLINEKGLENAIKVFNDKNGAFVWKDSYVFVMDLETGLINAHPFTPEAINNPKVLTFKDQNGKLFLKDFVKVAKKYEEGWVDYYWPKPGMKILSKKNTFVYKVPGKNLATLAGIYE